MATKTFKIAFSVRICGSCYISIDQHCSGLVLKNECCFPSQPASLPQSVQRANERLQQKGWGKAVLHSLSPTSSLVPNTGWLQHRAGRAR